MLYKHFQSSYCKTNSVLKRSNNKVNVTNLIDIDILANGRNFKNVTTRQGIVILRQQESKLDAITSFNDGTWKAETLSYLETFFSKESEEYQYFKIRYLIVNEYSNGAYSDKLHAKEIRQRI